METGSADVHGGERRGEGCTLYSTMAQLLCPLLSPCANTEDVRGSCGVANSFVNWYTTERSTSSVLRVVNSVGRSGPQDRERLRTGLDWTGPDQSSSDDAGVSCAMCQWTEDMARQVRSHCTELTWRIRHSAFLTRLRRREKENKCRRVGRKGALWALWTRYYPSGHYKRWRARGSCTEVNNTR
ncbi:hypothetical protein OBBRIDRAFT_594558 [Obba rivulosa]|uniref:Uncharacterized protein n=1 Tax=Obba rivulosa TaxID=1052685 RepID=A0A8E2B3C1_9APHY|nr:hypothetical protein OBBRIDRAFT_594558 [Obba rivulosa]